MRHSSGGWKQRSLAVAFAALSVTLATLASPAAAQPADGVPASPTGAPTSTEPAPGESDGAAPPAQDASGASAAPAESASSGSAPPPPPAPSQPPPADAAAALERARAAYEYGDIEMVVDSARLVAEGRLRPTPTQRAQALRFLGIGLYLTDRIEGAETAFFDLLRLKPGAKLDPTSTRPDVVAFFEGVRTRHADELREVARTPPGKRFIWCFLPPVGQFQNGHAGRGWTIAALEALSLGTAIATYAQLKSWQRPDKTFPNHTDDARTLKTLNAVSVGILTATVIVGIVDAIANYSQDHEERTLVRLTPTGLTLHF